MKSMLLLFWEIATSEFIFSRFFNDNNNGTVQWYSQSFEKIPVYSGRYFDWWQYRNLVRMIVGRHMSLCPLMQIENWNKPYSPWRHHRWWCDLVPTEQAIVSCKLSMAVFNRSSSWDNDRESPSWIFVSTCRESLLSKVDSSNLVVLVASLGQCDQCRPHPLNFAYFWHCR